MNTCVHLWRYLSEFILEWDILQTKVVEKITTPIFCSITFLKIVPFMTCGKAPQATDDNIIGDMPFACQLM